MRDIIIVNGARYDAETGKKIESHISTSSNGIHNQVQKSKILNRKFVKVPARNTSASDKADMIEQFKMRHNYIEIKKREILDSSNTSKALLPKGVRQISPLNNTAKIAPTAPQTIDEPNIIEEHPLHSKVKAQMREQNQPKVLPTAKEIKERDIEQALEAAKEQNIPSVKHGFRLNRQLVGFSLLSVLLVVGVAYGVNLALPGISTKIASIQSGLDVSLPSYKPSGYQLAGLVAFDGKTVNSQYKDGDNTFTIKQSESPWNSTALLEKYVHPKWKDDYSTYKEKGITVFRSANNEAAWVNDGKMYTLDGNNHLSGEEIAKIATSF